MMLRGARGTHALLSWASQTQNVVATSSSEAEVVALSVGSKELMINQCLLDTLFSKKIKYRIFSDSQACCMTVKAGKTANMKHLKKRQAVSVNFLKDSIGKILEKNLFIGCVIVIFPSKAVSKSL